ncbi:MAG TPA: sigma-54 dependent transcriptional regulator, partial [Polyangiaceae bacterium]|nr:sigma-54 dependent transcriptional regulator [Polyangiaceae bacterium]
VATRPGLPFVVMTGQGSMHTVIAALRLGARDFLTKPLDADSLLQSVARGIGVHRTGDVTPTPAEQDAAELTLSGPLGRCTRMRQLYELVRNLSDSLVSVVVEGETGTGKEVIARALHENSSVRSGPFIALSCAAMPAALLESELFGHVRGAFTDAKSAKNGLFLEANGGTLLLDEIGELPLELQPKLLRALQERKLRPLGGREEVPFDCRIIAATHRNLEEEVREKRFREDLYYRLNVVRITVPPLRERGDDILLLARHFLRRFAKKRSRNITFAESAQERIRSYGWPGNVRELENCIESAVALSRHDELSVDDFPDKIRFPQVGCDQPSKTLQVPDVISLVELEHRHILRVLGLSGGNKARAAKLLGINRGTLQRHLEPESETASRNEIATKSPRAPRS